MLRHLVLATALIAQPTFASTPNATRTFKDAFTEFASSPEFESTRLNIRAVELDFATRDLLLEPTIELDARRLNDRRYTYQAVAKSRDDNMLAIFTKPFSTGTTLTVTPSWDHSLLRNATPPDRYTFDWQIGITQDLWQDAFGRSTQLRWSREGYQKRQQISDALVKQAQAQVIFEAAYWDWAMALRERELREKNVQRGQEISRYIRTRFARSAAEASDVVQADALLANRQLQLATVEQTILNAAAAMERFVSNIQWQPDPNDLARPREADQLLTPWALDSLSTPERLELVSARNAALAAEKSADEAREAIRPNLSLQLLYGQNGIDPDSSDTALRQGFSSGHEQTAIGVVFKTGLDLGLEWKKVESARAASRAAELHRRALENEARVAWPQLKRNLGDFSERIKQAQRLAELQLKKANAERQRYRLGRSTAFQVVTFEQDAAEAEIAVWNLYAQMRKQEAQARLFAR